MKNHIYYRLEMKLASPLSVGDGKNESTDHDIVKNRNGTPFIPASSIAGVFRHTLDIDTKLQNEIFGNIYGENSHNSKVIFYNAELSKGSSTSVRDSVKLEKKVGVKGSKFDMEIIETGAELVTYLELPVCSESIVSSVEKMISELLAGNIRFGAKTSRGYGKILIISLKKKTFDLDDESELDAWLNFDVFNSEAWADEAEYSVSKTGLSYTKIVLNLTQKGAISIREYFTDAETNSPDYKHISLNDGTSVIPGTSWAGAFRDRYCEFAGSENAEKLFGYVRENNKTDVCRKSRIIFSESTVTDCIIKKITRNAIDRFSSAAKDAALYTEKTCYNGKTELEILLNNDVTDEEKNLLSAVILDLSNGFLSVGGLTSVGRGMFSVIGLTVNNEDRMNFLNPKDISQLLEVKS